MDERKAQGQLMAKTCPPKQESSSDKTYAGYMLNHNKKWREFAGMAFLIGVQEGLSLGQITEYVFETYHGLGLEEIADFFKNRESLRFDMMLYYENHSVAKEKNDLRVVSLHLIGCPEEEAKDIEESLHGVLDSAIGPYRKAETEIRELTYEEYKEIREGR